MVLESDFLGLKVGQPSFKSHSLLRTVQNDLEGMKLLSLKFLSAVQNLHIPIKQSQLCFLVANKVCAVSTTDPLFNCINLQYIFSISSIFFLVIPGN